MTTVNISERLNQIAQVISASPDFSTFTSDEEYMDYVVPLMNDTLYLLTISLALAHDEEEAVTGLPRNSAIVMGHMVRLRKHYEGFLQFIVNRQAELAAIFMRLMYETIVKVDYLFDAEHESFESYILSSYKAEKGNLQDLEKKESERPLTDIESRIKEKIHNRLNRDGISRETLFENTKWRMDGKSFFDILKHLGREDEYSYLLGSGSHFVQGGWYEISLHHLKQKGDYYTPHLEYDNPDPRLACPISAYCLHQMEKFVDWNETDPNEVVGPMLHNLCNHFRRIDEAHEEFYQLSNST